MREGEKGFDNEKTSDKDARARLKDSEDSRVVFFFFFYYECIR